MAKTKTKNNVVSFNGDVGVFRAQKAKKDAELKSITTTVCVIRPDFAEIARLCEDPSAAQTVMEAADEAHAKIEIPPRKGEMSVRWLAEKKVVCKNDGAVLRKISFDAHKGEIIVEFGEPFLTKVGAFYLENLGVGHIIELEPEQKELDFEGENRVEPDDGEGQE